MPIERGSTTHSQHVDDEMSHEVRGRVQGAESPRAEDWHEPEPTGEGQPDPDRVSGGPPPGTPAGMTEADVTGRSRLASALPSAVFPADRARLMAVATEGNAPDEVMDQLRSLPAHTRYQNVNEVWAALGHGIEDDRA